MKGPLLTREELSKMTWKKSLRGNDLEKPEQGSRANSVKLSLELRALMQYIAVPCGGWKY